MDFSEKSRKIILWKFNSTSLRNLSSSQATRFYLLWILLCIWPHEYFDLDIYLWSFMGGHTLHPSPQHLSQTCLHCKMFVMVYNILRKKWFFMSFSYLKSPIESERRLTTAVHYKRENDAWEAGRGGRGEARGSGTRRFSEIDRGRYNSLSSKWRPVRAQTRTTGKTGKKR